MQRGDGTVEGSTGIPRSANYFVRHWRGQNSLGWAFWVNGMLLNLLVGFGALGLGTAKNTALYDPIHTLVLVTGVWLIISIVLIWQVVGIWRSASLHPSRGGSKGWALAAGVVAVFWCISTIGTFLEDGLPILRLVIDAARGDPEMGRRSIAILAEGKEIELTGPISYGATSEVRDALDHTGAKILHLNSPGGRVGEAMKLLVLVRERGLVTYSSTGCSSACTIPFLGGKERWLTPPAALGFHRFSGYEEGSALDGIARDALSSIYTDLGLPAAFVDRMFATPSDTMWYPTPEELLSAHVVTGIAAPGQFAASVTKVKSVDEIEKALATKPIYRLLRSVEPDVYKALVNKWAEMSSAGVSEDQLIAKGQEILWSIYPKYIGKSPDAQIIAAAQLAVEQIRAVVAQNPKDCFRWAVQGQPVPSIGSYFTEEMRTRELALIEAVLEASIRSPQPAPSKAEIEPIFSPFLAKLEHDYPNEFVVLANVDSGIVDPAEACNAIALMYEQALKMPQQSVGPLLRYLFAAK